MSSLCLSFQGKHSDFFFMLIQTFLQHVNFRRRRSEKPPYSYTALICLALATTNSKMSLSEIHGWVREKFAFYRFGDQQWMVSSTFKLGFSSLIESHLCIYVFNSILLIECPLYYCVFSLHLITIRIGATEEQQAQSSGVRKSMCYNVWFNGS